jgi:hypothetical protein
VDTARTDVDAVGGEPQGSAASALQPAFVALVRGEEVRAYEVGVGLEGPGVKEK